jgi:hypothetical protein
MSKTELDNILAALIRMEHKTTGAMTPDEYWATASLARECGAPQFITEYFARKAITEE